jgi:hypothetical protein
VLVLLVRFFAGKYLVDSLVASETVRPAAGAAWDIITRSLADTGWVALAAGALVALGAWLIGPGERATAARAAAAPHLHRTGLAWGAFVVGMAVVVWLLPIQMFRTTAILVVASAIGFVVLRRQVAAETNGDVEAVAPAVPPAPEEKPPDEA